MVDFILCYNMLLGIDWWFSFQLNTDVQGYNTLNNCSSILCDETHPLIFIFDASRNTFEMKGKMF